MNTIIVLFGLVVLIAVIYKLLNHSDKTPDPLDKLEADAVAAVKTAEEKVTETLEKAATAAEVVKKGTCGCGRSPTGNCVGLHKLSDAEWAMSDQNPNRVQVAPVVVTADTPSETVAEAEPVATKKPRAKKAAAPKASKKSK
jgi:beta-lactam-binding protein with PASTA domain